MLDSKEITDRYNKLTDEIENICSKVGRNNNVKIVAVTKYLKDEELAILKNTPITDIGENRIQNAVRRKEILPDKGWHMVGHIQTNKAKDVVKVFDTIHSLDSAKLSDKLQSRLHNLRSILHAFVEVNIFGESQKNGVEPEKAGELLSYIKENCDSIKVTGLMCMAPYEGEEKTLHKGFSRLRELAKTHGLKELSMGMTDDWRIAVKEGSTCVRIGRYFFT